MQWETDNAGIRGKVVNFGDELLGTDNDGKSILEGKYGSWIMIEIYDRILWVFT